MDMKTKRQLAIRWFLDHGIPVSEDDGSLFIEVRKESIQISTAEILFRAELQAAELEP